MNAESLHSRNRPDLRGELMHKLDEVSANNLETASRCELWLEQLKKEAAETNAMFGTTVSVDWRHDPDKMIVTNTQVGEGYYGKSR